MEKYFIDLDDVLPFLQFFIERYSLNEAAEKSEGATDLNHVDLIARLYVRTKKESIVSFKNSLLINAHFKNRFIAK